MCNLSKVNVMLYWLWKLSHIITMVVQYTVWHYLMSYSVLKSEASRDVFHCKGSLNTSLASCGCLAPNSSVKSRISPRMALFRGVFASLSAPEVSHWTALESATPMSYKRCFLSWQETGSLVTSTGKAKISGFKKVNEIFSTVRCAVE